MSDPEFYDEAFDAWVTASDEAEMDRQQGWNI